MVRDRVREQDPLQGLKKSFLVQLIMYVWGSLFRTVLK